LKIIKSTFIIQNFPYPLLLQSYPPGFQLYIPDPEQVKPVYEKLLVIHPDLPFPFWAKVWPAARAMTEFLLSHPDLTNNKKVLEIGAGIGLPSFSIASNISELIISDHDPDAVALLDKNIALLGLKNTRALLIDWNHFPPDLHADTILLSDINYAPEQFESLLKLMKLWMESGTTVVLSTPQRIMGVPFVEALTAYISFQTSCIIEEPGGMTDISILVLQQRKNDAE
jgi:predicted nicotinamide N-methyase